MEDQTTDYVHKKQSLANNASSKIMDSINSPIQTYFIDFKQTKEKEGKKHFAQ